MGDLNPNYMDICTLAYAVGISTRFEFQRNFFNLVMYLSREKKHAVAVKITTTTHNPQPQTQHIIITTMAAAWIIWSRKWPSDPHVLPRLVRSKPHSICY